MYYIKPKQDSAQIAPCILGLYANNMVLFTRLEGVAACQKKLVNSGKKNLKFWRSTTWNRRDIVIE